MSKSVMEIKKKDNCGFFSSICKREYWIIVNHVNRKRKCKRCIQGVFSPNKLYKQRKLIDEKKKAICLYNYKSYEASAILIDFCAVEKPELTCIEMRKLLKCPISCRSAVYR